jgi:sugar lactone lactonase YvrE
MLTITHNSVYLAFVDLSPTAVWNQSATTVAGAQSGISGSSNGYLNSPGSLTISTDDILYIADQDNNRVVVVNLTSSTIIRNLGSVQGAASNQFYWPNDISVTETSIYVLDSKNYRVQKWSINGTNPSTVPGTGSIHYSFYMFMDKYGSLYVSVLDDNTVIRFAPNSSVFLTIAGTGSSGAQSNRLSSPYGIFVDDNLTLYIADYNNNRIQMWKYGASTGTTVVGTGTSGATLAELNNPSAVLVDTNGYMYIADSGNNRIVRWAPNSTSGICIVACTGSSGTNSNRLNYPSALAFDSNGSLYVCDLSNNRVQKFQSFDNQSKNPMISTRQEFFFSNYSR